MKRLIILILLIPLVNSNLNDNLVHYESFDNYEFNGVIDGFGGLCLSQEDIEILYNGGKADNVYLFSDTIIELTWYGKLKQSYIKFATNIGKWFLGRK